MMAKGMFQTERPHMEGIEEGSAGGPVCLGYFNWEGGVGVAGSLQGDSRCVGPCAPGRGMWPFSSGSWGVGRTYEGWSGGVRMTF